LQKEGTHPDNLVGALFRVTAFVHQSAGVNRHWSRWPAWANGKGVWTAPGVAPRDDRKLKWDWTPSSLARFGWLAKRLARGDGMVCHQDEGRDKKMLPI
jgi:hypothetical protein